MREHFKKIYPKCSTNEIENLVSAIISSKYWKVHFEKRNVLYVVALTKAKIPFKDGFKAKSTAPKTVVVSYKAARFCKRGRILIVKDRGEDFISETVVEWLVFLKLIRQDQNLIYQFFIEYPDPPPFLNSRIFKKIQRRCLLLWNRERGLWIGKVPGSISRSRELRLRVDSLIRSKKVLPSKAGSRLVK